MNHGFEPGDLMVWRGLQTKGSIDGSIDLFITDEIVLAVYLCDRGLVTLENATYSYSSELVQRAESCQ